MLNLDALSLSRNGKTLLSDVSWQLKSGAINAIVGRNGAGKSTLIQLLSGQDTPDTGSVLLDGQPLQALSVAQRARHIALVSQKPDNVSHLSVRECLALGCLPWASSASLRNKEVAAEVEHWLEQLDLVALADNSFVRLSGGEQQRVLLGQAFAQRTPVLLLDEPTNHLDITQQYQLMQSLQSSGKTLVVTLHDINLARRFAEQLLLLDQGRVVAAGKTADLLNGPLLEELYEMLFVELHSDQLSVEHFAPVS